MTRPARRPAKPVQPPADTGSAPAPTTSPGAPAPAAGAPGLHLGGHAHGPVVYGFLFALGALGAWWLSGLLAAASGVILLVVVSMFLAAGLHPSVEFFVHRGLARPWGVLIVISAVLLALTLFVVALVPVISDQVTALVDQAPGWLTQLEQSKTIQRIDEQYDVIKRVQDFITSGDWASGLFGGVVGVGLAVLSALSNTFIVTVLTLYFLASLAGIKHALYQLAPSTKRARVAYLGDRILDSVGGYVSGAFIVAMTAGITSLIFLIVIGLGEYAVALAAVVALLDVIPMIGATLGAVVVTAIGFATDVRTGVACLIFYVVYQQIENYIIYPRVMRRSVNVPGAVTVIAALVGAALLGVVGALLAIPTAAAILLLVREVWLPHQETR